jgi:hypothetical protein
MHGGKLAMRHPYGSALTVARVEDGEGGEAALVRCLLLYLPESPGHVPLAKRTPVRVQNRKSLAWENRDPSL